MGSRTQVKKFLAPPLLVCEPVLVEACFLLARLPGAEDALFGLIDKGALSLAFHLDEHLEEINVLREKYRDRPISLADACIIRMAELFDDHLVFTLDSDFAVYRKHGRKSLSLIYPGRAWARGTHNSRSTSSKCRCRR